MQQQDIRNPDQVFYPQGTPITLQTPDMDFDFTLLRGAQNFLPTITFAKQPKMGTISIIPRFPDDVFQQARDVIVTMSNDENASALQAMAHIAASIQALNTRDH